MDPIIGPRLRAARVATHRALQPVAAAGRALGPPRPDDLQTSTSWLEEPGGLIGVELGGQIRVGLSLKDRKLLVYEGSEQAEAHSLVGRTLGEGFVWLGQALERRGLSVPVAGLTLPDYDLPSHPVATSARFEEPDHAAQKALHGWFAEAVAVLQRVRAEQPGAGELRCWPHHFDLATLLRLSSDGGDTGDARTIGVGLSPGDGRFPDPYYYVTPWPYPDPDRLPPLSMGLWHTSGWVGALLCAAEIGREPTPDDRAERIGAFLRSAIGGLRGMLAN